MVEVESINEIITVEAFIVSRKELNDVMLKYNKVLLNKPKIPNIIDLNKEYMTFSVIDLQKKVSKDKVICLLNSDFLDDDDSDFFGAKNPNILLGSCKIDVLESLGCERPEIYSWEFTEIFDLKLCLNFNYFSYKEILRKILPSNCKIPTSFEIIGEILHLNLTEDLLIHKKIIGEVLYKKIKNIKSVVTKIGNISNEFRFFEMEVLEGDHDLNTKQIENGLIYFLDYSKMYWNSKLQSERKIILNYFKPNETICDLFCGVGPFVIPALKKGCIVYANDLNKDSITYLKKNVVENKVHSSKIFIFNENAFSLIKTLKTQNTTVNHFILNLPEKSLLFFKEIVSLNFNSMIHCYFFCKEFIQPWEFVYNEISIEIPKSNFEMIRSVSPSKNMWKITINLHEIEKSNF
ncbi:tRNA (guanine(37)-N1)-methyltransferase [Hamiltosporidium tvaerminnensis]|uniref:tRNA (guanine(37)-N1)-methyltransferase n=1 Tax=Hamiltosporidium tvaerminnensis TaxID=1176355 RepID=A0A4Q9LSZ5_9MICR|nr:tRNA (guanine(37)-N1)-methyltransferase [Hamiltosporidium tvaerminnensis]